MELLDFYAYVFLDQRKPGSFSFGSLVFEYQPFYVGVGRQHRMKAHFTPSSMRERNLKNSTIKAIYNATGERPLHMRILDNASQEAVFGVEIEFIKHFGRKENGGILCNMTDGGEGNLGLVHSEEFLNTLRKPVHQYTLEGVYVKSWPSAVSVRTEMGLNVKSAARCCKTAGGFQWRYTLESSVPAVVRHQPKFRFTATSPSEVLEFRSFKDAQEHFKQKGKTLSFGNVSSCATGRIKTYFGYSWTKTCIAPADN